MGMERREDIPDSTMEERLEALARMIENVMPKGIMFCLAVFEVEGERRASYVSNTRRLEMPSALRELADAMASDIARRN